MSDRQFLEENIQNANKDAKENRERIKRLKIYKEFSDKYEAGTPFKIIDKSNSKWNKFYIGFYGGGAHFYFYKEEGTDDPRAIFTHQIDIWECVEPDAKPIIAKNIILIPLKEQ